MIIMIQQQQQQQTCLSIPCSHSSIAKEASKPAGGLFEDNEVRSNPLLLGRGKGPPFWLMTGGN